MNPTIYRLSKAVVESNTYEEISAISATASVAILLIALIIAIVGRIRKSRKLCKIASWLDFLSFILFVPFFVSVGCMFIYYGESAGSSGTAVVSSVVLVIVWLLPWLIARSGKKAAQSSVEATVLPKNDSAAVHQMPETKAEPASISVANSDSATVSETPEAKVEPANVSVANKVNAMVPETPEAKVEPANVSVANKVNAMVPETPEAKVEPANVSIANKVNAMVPETKEVKAEPADGKVSNKVPKFLLVVGVLNALLCLYGGLGYWELIKIALIGGAVFLGMKGKKALTIICGILVLAVAILPNVQALPYIGDWPVPMVLVFFADAILSILFMIATFTVKKIAPAPKKVSGGKGRINEGTDTPAGEAASEGENCEAYCELGKHIILCLFTFGIWYLIWIYRTTKYLNNTKNVVQYNPKRELLLCMFVPFYQIFWFYQHGPRIDAMSKQKKLNASEMSTLCLILGIFIPIVACILMQERINMLCTAKETVDEEVAADEEQRPAVEEKKAAVKEQNAADSTIEQLKKFKELLDMGVITQEEFDAKKKQLLGL